MYPYVPSTFLAIYNLLFIGCSIAKILGYELIHYVEYDAEFNSCEIIDYASQVIQEGHDAMIISETDFDMNGGFFSFDLRKYNYSDFEYDEKVLLDNFKRFIFPENFTRNFFLKNKKLKVIDYFRAKEIGYNNTKHIRTKHDRPFVFPFASQGKFFIVHDNRSKIVEKLVVIVNDGFIFSKETNPYFFNITPIGLIDSVNKITIIVNDVIEKIYDLSSDEKKQKIFDNCYIKKLN
jgi:hypothetical protein